MDVRGPEQPAVVSQERDMTSDQDVNPSEGDRISRGNDMEPAALLLRTGKQMEFLDMVRELRQSLEEKTSECGSLRIKLSESDERAEMLSRELDGFKLTMFQNHEDSKKLHEEVTKSKKLEEDYVKLMDSYLILEERYEQHRQNLYNTYLAKTNAINNYECIMSREVLKHELEESKAELHQKSAELSLVSAKLRNLEEEVSAKEICITELKKSLDDARAAHKHEITVLEDYIQCLKNTITSYERTLATYQDTRLHGRLGRIDVEHKEKEEGDGENDQVERRIEVGQQTNSTKFTTTTPHPDSGPGANRHEENGDI